MYGSVEMESVKMFIVYPMHTPCFHGLLMAVCEAIDFTNTTIKNITHILLVFEKIIHGDEGKRKNKIQNCTFDKKKLSSP